MSNITSVNNKCALNFPSVKETCQSSGKAIAIALGILSIISAAVAAGVLYGYVGVGNVAFHSLWGVPFGFSLIILSYFYKTPEDAEPVVVDTAQSPQIVENEPTISIGSKAEPLDEKGIREALWALKDKKGITTLIIYSNKTNDYNIKPGCVCMYAQKLTLRGERMISDACNGHNMGPGRVICYLNSSINLSAADMPNPEEYFIEAEVSPVEESGSFENQQVKFKIDKRSTQ